MTTTTTRTAIAEWNPPDDLDPHGAWSVHVEDVPGANTQVRRLDQVEENIAEAIELMTGEAPGTYDLVVRWEAPGEAGALALADEARRLQEAAKAAPPAVQRAARALRAAGFTVRDIGRMVGVSHQRVHQILH